MKIFIQMVAFLVISCGLVRADLIIVEPVTGSEVTSNATDAVISGIIRSGGAGTTGTQAEFEASTESSSYEGNTSYPYDVDIPFELSVSDTGFLNLSVNGTTIPSGSRPAVISPWNVLYVRLSLDDAIGDNQVDVSHFFEGTALPDMSVQDSEEVAYRVYFDSGVKTENMGDVGVSGTFRLTSQFPGVFGPTDVELEYYGGYDSSVVNTVPEPGSGALALLFGGLLAAMRKFY